MKNNKLNLSQLLAVVFAFSFSQSQAATIDLTLTPDTDPLIADTGDVITWIVGIAPTDTIITGYTLDIRYDPGELDYLSSEQLVPFFDGAFVPPFTLDPGTTGGDTGSNGLENSSSGRASVLQTSNSEPVGDLFSLTFEVKTTVNDGNADLTVGLLNLVANDINPPVGDDPFDYGVREVSVQVIPVPAAVWLFGSGLLGLFAVARRKMS